MYGNREIRRAVPREDLQHGPMLRPTTSVVYVLDAWNDATQRGVVEVFAFLIRSHDEV